MAFAEPKLATPRKLKTFRLTCTQLSAALERYLETLPNKCQIDMDCRAQFLHVDSCARPYLLHKYYIPEADSDFVNLRARAEEACVEETAKHPKCVKQVLTPFCNEGKCDLKLWFPVRQPPPEEHGWR